MSIQKIISHTPIIVLNGKWLQRQNSNNPFQAGPGVVFPISQSSGNVAQFSNPLIGKIIEEDR